MGLEIYIVFRQKPSKICLHFTVERNNVFFHICIENVESTEVPKNVMNNYEKIGNTHKLIQRKKCHLQAWKN